METQTVRGTWRDRLDRWRLAAYWRSEFIDFCLSWGRISRGRYSSTAFWHGGSMDIVMSSMWMCVGSDAPPLHGHGRLAAEVYAIFQGNRPFYSSGVVSVSAARGTNRYAGPTGRGAAQAAVPGSAYHIILRSLLGARPDRQIVFEGRLLAPPRSPRLL